MIIYLNISPMNHTRRSTILRYRSDLAEQKNSIFIHFYICIMFPHGNAFHPLFLLCQILKTCYRRRAVDRDR